MVIPSPADTPPAQTSKTVRQPHKQDWFSLHIIPAALNLISHVFDSHGVDPKCLEDVEALLDKLSLEKVKDVISFLLPGAHH